jgi:amino acid adenylation domain-containing protein
LKAGAAYVPLDPGYPVERLATMAKRSKLHSIICGASRLGEWGGRSNAVILTYEQLASECLGMDARDLNETIHPSQAAYTLFTSGSTGEPKGAINTHEGICNRLSWMQEAYPLDGTERVLQKTPIGFDVSGWEFFWPLIAGATLVIAKPGVHTDPEYLATAIQTARITTIHFVPSMLRLFLDEPRVRGCVSLRRIICSGEALTTDLAQRCHDALGCDLHNLYGPTEAAIDVTAWTCIRGDLASPIPIGHPIANTRAFVLDRDLLPCPVGVAGELYLGGPQLARGYVSRADLTAERFLPCAWPDAEPGARMYRTGDRARVRSDGAVTFLGRIDAQVKLHGVRIEPEEIEAVLARHPACAAAAVVMHDDGAGHTQLIAYVVPRSTAVVSWDELRTWLGARLPAAMVPSRIEMVRELPLTASGKLDRRRLASMQIGAAPDESQVASLLELLEGMSEESARQYLADVGQR